MKWFKDVDNVSIESVEEFYNLVETHVYSKGDLIADSLTMDFETTLPVPREVEWEDFTESLFHGRCFTARNIGELQEGHNFKVHLNTNISDRYKIWLHDPDFFITALNPSSVPTLENYLDLRNSSMGGGLLGGFQYFRGEQHVLINREEFPCTDYTQLGSSFSQCVSQYLVNQVGCRVSVSMSSNTTQSSVVLQSQFTPNK